MKCPKYSLVADKNSAWQLQSLNNDVYKRHWQVIPSLVIAAKRTLWSIDTYMHCLRRIGIWKIQSSKAWKKPGNKYADFEIHNLTFFTWQRIWKVWNLEDWVFQALEGTEKQICYFWNIYFNIFCIQKVYIHSDTYINILFLKMSPKLTEFFQFKLKQIRRWSRICQGGWLAGPKNFSRRAGPRKNVGALLGGSGAMFPEKIFKIESARLA